MIEIELTGFEGLAAALEQLGQRIADTVAKSLHSSAELTMTRSKSEFCPVDTGFLKSSGYVKTTTDGPIIETTLGYNADYAIYVHEINKRYRNGKQWKYLETPLKQDLPSYEKAMRDAVEGLMK